MIIYMIVLYWQEKVLRGRYPYIFYKKKSWGLSWVSRVNYDPAVVNYNSEKRKKISQKSFDQRLDIKKRLKTNRSNKNRNNRNNNVNIYNNTSKTFFNNDNLNACSNSSDISINFDQTNSFISTANDQIDSSSNLLPI